MSVHALPPSALRGEGMTSQRARDRLVARLREDGIHDLRVLEAIRRLPRHHFIDEALASRAYEDTALPIGQGQTISQPSMHARYLELLRLTGNERVLEIGTGSGYQTALLAHLASQVFSIERVAPLLERARDAIRQAGARNVSVLVGDGTLGWRDYGPYDAILVTAGAPEIPKPLAEQLADGGRLLIPLGGREEQILTLVTRRAESLERRDIAPARFVPLIGTFGWAG
jgi:protein-L-isoaspartate(D-aspartate) O-methyltransferase